MTAIKERPILFSADSRWIKTAASRIGVSAEAYASELNRGRKYCGGCKRSLPRTLEFYGAEGKYRDGLRSKCRECVSVVKKAHYHANRPRLREKRLAYQRDNRERLYAYNAAWNRKRNAELRTEAHAAYGGRCACCGETEPAFLQLDHIHNDGAACRKQFKTATQLILHLKQEGWPTDRIQLLCANCNFGKLMNDGVCPHITRGRA